MGSCFSKKQGESPILSTKNLKRAISANSLKISTKEINLSDFTLQRSLGKGAFGKVRIVHHTETKSIYALKYINKLKCIKQQGL
jgi:serine/threonine protein kinase